jgi:hypothetical protein
LTQWDGASILAKGVPTFMKCNDKSRQHGLTMLTLIGMVLIASLFSLPRCSAGRELSLSSIQFRQMDTSVANIQEWVENIRQLKGMLFQYTEHQIFQRLSPNWIKRVGFLLPMMVVNYQFTSASAVVLHEVGHAEFAHHYGANPKFGIGWKGSDAKTGLTVPELFWECLISNRRTFTYYRNSDLSLVEDTFVRGDGINANTIYARDLSRLFTVQDQYSVFDSWDYTYNKAYGTGYFATNLNKDDGDPASYVQALKRQGVETSVKEIFWYKLASCLLSGGLINTLRTYWTYLGNGEPAVQPFHLSMKGYTGYLPEQMIYLNPDNVSYSVEVMLQRPPYTFMTLGYETPIIGASKSGEFLLGYDRQFESWGLQARATINQHLNYFLTLAISKKIHQNLAIFSKVYYGDQGTQRQQREWVDSRGTILIGIQCFL